jgi:tripartite-type tricarboxylate transporter receptor subunit TctC
MVTKRAILLALVAAGFGMCAGRLAAENYPKKTIKIVVPFPPGTPSEFFIRLLADRLSSKFGQAVIVENRPGGAGGTVGAAAVAGAEPDGYTLLASPPGPLTTAAALYKNLGYEPGKSFAPVALLFSSPQLLAVNPAIPARSLREFVDYVKGNPGKISIASPGYGTQPHLLAEMFKSMAGINVVHVPYKGPGPAVTDLLAGHVQVYFETAPVILPHADAGKLRILAVAGASRMAQLPTVPTTIESGFQNLTGGFWSGILAPAGTPASIVDQLNTAINEIMRSQDAQLALIKLGGEAKLGSPHDFAAFIAAETQKWSTIIKATGVKIE